MSCQERRLKLANYRQEPAAGDHKLSPLNRAAAPKDNKASPGFQPTTITNLHHSAPEQAPPKDHQASPGFSRRRPQSFATQRRSRHPPRSPSIARLQPPATTKLRHATGGRCPPGSPSIARLQPPATTKLRHSTVGRCPQRITKHRQASAAGDHKASPLNRGQVPPKDHQASPGFSRRRPQSFATQPWAAATRITSYLLSGTKGSK